MRNERLGGEMHSAAGECLRRVVTLVVLMLFFVGSSKVSAQTGPGDATPVRLMAEQDHQRLMELLHISWLRRGPSGDPKAPDAANVDESKVPPYTLPDPLVLKNGKKVQDAGAWWKLRRPEVVEEFDREIL